MCVLGRSKHVCPSATASYSIDSYTEQLSSLILQFFPLKAEQSRLFIIGHSLGGAIAANLMHQLAVRRQDPDTVVVIQQPFGLAILDIVEGW
jgi:alpha-beta hydrolase superfamily lysophospholipase